MAEWIAMRFDSVSLRIYFRDLRRRRNVNAFGNRSFYCHTLPCWPCRVSWERVDCSWHQHWNIHLLGAKGLFSPAYRHVRGRIGSRDLIFFKRDKTVAKTTENRTYGSKFQEKKYREITRFSTRHIQFDEKSLRY